eukprot:18942-Eustigmatos_ZCMA.PRE.1
MRRYRAHVNHGVVYGVQSWKVTAADTAILRWVFPVRVVPPRDVDVTDLFLDHDVPRCSAE